MATSERRESATAALDEVIESAESGGDDVTSLVAAAEECLSSGQAVEAVPLLERAVLNCDHGDAELCSVLWNMLGNVHLRLGDSAKAIYCHLHDLASCREAGDGEGCTKAYANLGLAFKHAGQLEKAGQCFASQLQSCERRRHQAGMARAFNNLAQLTLLMAKNAMKECRQRTNAAQTAGRDNAEASRISGLKDSIKQRLSQSAKFFLSHLQIVSKQRDKLAEARSHGNIAECYELLNKYGKAIEHHTRRLTMAEEQRDLEGMSRGHCNIGNCLRSLHEHQEAIDHYLKDLQITKELGDLAGQALTQRNLANTYDMMGDFDKSLICHSENLALVQELGQRNEQILSLGYAASIHEDMEQYDMAIDCYSKQIDVYIAAKSDEGQEQATANIQRIHGLLQRKRDGIMGSPAASPKPGKAGIFDSARRFKEGTLRIFNRKDRRSVLAKEESPWVTDLETPPVRRRQLKGSQASYKVCTSAAALPGRPQPTGVFNPITGRMAAANSTERTEKALAAVVGSMDAAHLADSTGDSQPLLAKNFILRTPSQEAPPTRVSIYSTTFGGRAHSKHLQMGVGSMLHEMVQDNPLFTAFKGEQDWQPLLAASNNTSMAVGTEGIDDVDMGMFEKADTKTEKT